MDWIEEIKNLMGNEIISTKSDVLRNYASDYTEDLEFLPEVVAKPQTVKDISNILAFCNDDLLQ